MLRGIPLLSTVGVVGAQRPVKRSRAPQNFSRVPAGALVRKQPYEAPRTRDDRRVLSNPSGLRPGCPDEPPRQYAVGAPPGGGEPRGRPPGGRGGHKGQI